ncbi:MAG: 40S ribosomal protein S17 [Nitrosarchaeum sp.]|nr:40S ribosomal protein S17 [Nitrosarchaeum sp.]
MDRIKRLSYEVLDGHKSKFGEDFASNKKVLDQISIIRSKGLKNEMAGYITKFIKREIREEKAKQAQRTIAQEEVVSEDELTLDENIDVDETEDAVVEASESYAESDENSE